MADDLASLDSIDADAVMATLQQRYDANKIYTRNGSVLVAINPYKDVQLYTDGHLKDYQSALALDKMPPHVFAVAAEADVLVAVGKRNLVSRAVGTNT